MGFIDDLAKRFEARDGKPPRPEQRRALTAAGAPVNLAKPALSHTKREQWQTESWGFRDTIPEMRFAGDFVASTLGRLRVFPAENRPRGEEPVPLERASKRGQANGEVGVDQETIDAAVEAVERLNLNSHGASLLSRFAENLEYAGECFLLGEKDDDSPGGNWSIRSISEVQLTQGGGRLVDPDSGMALRELRNTECDLMRLWTPHPRFYDRPDAAVRSLLDVLEGMYLLGKRGRAHDRSRISAGKGLYIPQELLVMGSSGAPISADMPGSTQDSESNGMFERIQEYMTTGLTAEGDPSTVVPLVFIGPAMSPDGTSPMKDVIGTFDLHGEDPKNLDERYEALVMRFARGINLSPERVKGIGEATNQWSAQTVTAEEVKTAVEPRAERMCDSLTAAYLHRMLKAMGISAEQRAKVCLWFDPSELTQNPNRGQDATTLFNAGELSGEALRAANGFTESDAPSSAERLRRQLSTERLAPGSIPAMIALEQGRMPTTDDITAVDRASARLAAQGQRPVVDATPNRTTPPSLAKPPASKPAPKPDPTPPVGQRTQPATASQPGALGASAGRDHAGKFAGEGQARQWRLDRDLGQKLAQIDRDFTTRVLAAADATLGRALEKAANRARGRAQKDPKLAAHYPKGSDPRAVLAAGGRRLANGMTDDELLADAFDDLEVTFLAEADRAANAVEDILERRLASSAVTAAGSRGVAERIRGNAGQAWQWLRNRLRSHASAVLFGGQDAQRGGERSPGLTPLSLVRGAGMLLGGLGERHPGMNDDGTPASRSGAPTPSHGPGSGDVALSRLRVAGALELGWEWEHFGAQADPFPGHAQLDGVTFGSWTDPRLLVKPDDAWLGRTHYAIGDHRGCSCTGRRYVAIPLVVGADQDSDEVAELRRKVTDG